MKWHGLGRMGSPMYQAMLETHLAPFHLIIGGKNSIFQQGSNPYPLSKATVKWFRPKKIRVQECHQKAQTLTQLKTYGIF